MAPRRAQYARGKWADARSINSIITDYKNFVDVVEEEAMRIMQGAAEITLDYVKPYVPIDTGALLESGTANAVKTSKGVAALVSFGGPENPVKPTKNAPAGIVDYAAVVNYDVTKIHAIGEDQFLEKGTLESKDEVDAYIMRELRKIKP